MSSHPNNTSVEDFDVVVVGSGFGGAVTAYRQAEAGRTVCLLERGQAYAPGDFPRNPAKVAKNLWDPSEGLYGLFDLWSFRRLDAIVASGLGGGSLIYANVLLRKDEKWFYQNLPGGGMETWPVTLVDLESDYKLAEEMLHPVPYPDSYARSNRKTVEFERAAGGISLIPQRVPIAVTFGDPAKPGVIFDDGRDNYHGVPRMTCRQCGECDVGCNSGSKNTLDMTYLSKMDRRFAVIRPHCEVKSFRPVQGGWEVDYVRHLDGSGDPPAGGSRRPLLHVRARQMVLSAGSLGTTYLLLRNRAAIPRVSDRVGQSFSGNGDFLGFLTDLPEALDPSVGPVITSSARVPDVVDGGDGPGFYIQNGGYPGIVDWLNELIPPFEIGLRLAKLMGLRVWKGLTDANPTRVSHQLAALVGDSRKSANVLPLLVMGRDCPDSTLFLKHGYLDCEVGPGSSEYFRSVRCKLKELAEDMGADYHDSISAALSRAITVHPLGGAAMATTPQQGVVNTFGEVFGHPGLFIADGSVMPGPVGANPSLTIAALAERFSRHMIDQATP
jgi:cholesterol oxidase